MRKTYYRLLSFVLVVVMMLSVMACEKKEESVSQSKNFAYGEVWSAPSTVKIKKTDIKYKNKGPAELSYQAVRNEYESVQLFITADKDITSFELEKADLKCGSDTISADNIDVYMQKYVYINDNAGTGDFPDALLPMETAAAYKENTVKENENGAIWTTIYIPKETPKGTYEGTFLLTADGKKGEKTMEIPVTVEVLDYTLTDESNAETLFTWRFNRVGTGELNGSMDMITKYYEFFLDYRISLQSLPIATLSGEEMLEDILTYYDRLSSYTILSEKGTTNGNLDEAEEVLKEQIFTIAAASTPERDLFDKAIIYFIDEPNFMQEGSAENVVSRYGVINRYLQECVDVIKADDSGTYTEFKKIEDWEESILDIPNILTIVDVTMDWLLANEDTELAQQVLSSVNCFCPLFSEFENHKLARILEMAEKYDIELWWYGCVGTYPPSATYFIADENLLSARTVSWLQKKYDIVGNLYWDVVAFSNGSAGYNNMYENPFHDDGQFILPAGDGFIAYAGAQYGLDGPVPSIRLMSIRDGMEEYELLRDLELQMEGLSDTFGSDFSIEEYMNSFYENLYYNGVNLNADGENGLNFTEVRTELLQSIVGVKNGLALYIGDIKVDGSHATFNCYVQKGATVTIDGEKQESDKDVYSYELNLDETEYVEVTVTNAEGDSVTHHKYVASPQYVLNALSEEAVLAGIDVTEGGTAALVNSSEYATDGTAVQMKVTGRWSDNNLLNATFIPSASVDTSLFDEYKLADFTTVFMDIYNPNATFEAKVCFYSGDVYAEVANITVEQGKNTIVLDIKDVEFSELSNVDRIVFEFENAKDGKALSYEFYLDNIVGAR